MADQERLDVTELDFDGIKNNLKIFMKSQSEFTDYDFEGSGINALLDVLAYNTHYLAFNANMEINEAFLDSASQRSSVVSHAKTLGYEPHSVSSSVAVINVILDNVPGDAITMPANTKFNTTLDEESYTFVTTDSFTVSKDGTRVTFNNIPIYEGTYVTTRYVVDSTDVEQRFLINDAMADTRTLKVTVQNSASDGTQAVYTKATDISQLTGVSKVYYLQEVEDGNFEVFFGDGVVSQKVNDGNIIFLDFVVSNKDLANGASVFTNAAVIGGIQDVTVTTVSAAGGGGERETISSIKLLAPLDYAAQGRCVTPSDYKTYTKKFFPQTQAVQVFGGEDGSWNPSTGVSSTPEYGRVFISIKSKSGNLLTSAQKAQLVKDLKQYNVASITPVIVDPDTTNLILQIVFKFDSTITAKGKSTIVSLVNNDVKTWNTTNLLDFNKPFRHSDLLKTISNADDSILSCSCNVSLAKYITPTLATARAYTVSFNNALYYPHSGHNAGGGGVVASTGFYIMGDTTNKFFWDDDGKGNLRRYYLVGSTRTYVDANAGTVDYANGIITTKSISISTIDNVDEIPSTKIRITVVPNSKDIIPLRNQLLEIDFTNTEISGEVDTIAVAGQGGIGTYNAVGTRPSTKSY